MARELPVGMTEFENWSNALIELAGSPNNDSVKFALATMILHAPADQHEYEDDYFVSRLKKAMANQIAAGVMQDLKAKQEAAAKQVEATTQPSLSVVSNEQPKNG